MKKSTIKGRYQWYLRTCNEASALFSVTPSFIEALRKYQGYLIELLYKLLLETIHDYNNKTWPFVKNPTPRIQEYLNQLNIKPWKNTSKPDHKKRKGIQNNSCSFKFIKPRVTNNFFYKPAWKVGQKFGQKFNFFNSCTQG